MPAIIQDGNSGQVLMLGYMDRDAVLQTFKLKRVTFYSRSKERLWTKGESSGHYLKFKEMCLDCDADSLLIQADPMGPTCHTGADTCFGNEKWGLSFIEHLQGVIADRQRNPSTTSYTSSGVVLRNCTVKSSDNVGRWREAPLFVGFH